MNALKMSVQSPVALCHAIALSIQQANFPSGQKMQWRMLQGAVFMAILIFFCM